MNSFCSVFEKRCHPLTVDHRWTDALRQLLCANLDQNRRWQHPTVVIYRLIHQIRFALWTYEATNKPTCCLTLSCSHAILMSKGDWFIRLFKWERTFFESTEKRILRGILTPMYRSTLTFSPWLIREYGNSQMSNLWSNHKVVLFHSDHIASLFLSRSFSSSLVWKRLSLQKTLNDVSPISALKKRCESRRC